MTRLSVSITGTFVGYVNTDEQVGVVNLATWMEFVDIECFFLALDLCAWIEFLRIISVQ